MKKALFLLYYIFSASLLAPAQNYAFRAGERIEYSVGYSVIGIYLPAGTAWFTTAKTDTDNVFHFVGEGSTNKRYDWIFKVRDRYESYYDAKKMQPLKSVRNVSEGKYKKYEETVFDHKNNTATNKKGTFKVPPGIQDVISMVYQTRNADFSKYKPGDKITFNMFFGSDIYNMYIKYVGKETVKTKYGNIKTIKLMPLLLKGSVFKGGEDMTVWVTDDNNHIPVKIESKLSVGSIKVNLSNYQNLQHPIAFTK
jgi:hypothetical protein